MGEGKKGLTIERYFSLPYEDVYTDPKNIIQYKPRTVEIRDDQGQVIEKLENAVFPEWWSQNSANTTATKYFRRKDIPNIAKETDVRQVIERVAKKLSKWGTEIGYFDKKEAENFEQELAALTIGQYGAFNSPVWFNLGLDLYGIKQHGENFYVKNGKAKKVDNYYEHPQLSACFISSPDDSIEDMIEVGAVVSSRVFKGGSGIGGDWSKVRSAGEPVSGGGYASGAKRFMDVQDSCGRVIKSGGKTRRAATMQSIHGKHPDMFEIIRDKYKEEIKAGVLVKAGSPSNWESHTIQDLRGQNVNISIRTDDDFWRAYENNENYKIRRVIDGKVIKEMPARKLARLIAFATHGCGDPGIHYHDIINSWNTCKASGDIWATNPCTEFNGVNDSACNLASLNVIRFRKVDGNFDLESCCRAVDSYIIAQDIIASEASYPTKKIALNSDALRPLGLGIANLGAYVMSLGLPYDSDEARDFAAALMSNITAEAYLQSMRLAKQLGPFKEFEKNRESMFEVLEKHRKAAKQLPKRNGLEELVESANKKWEEVIEEGKKYGFRNSQVTLIAPTGTIGLMMGCDTTGGEPAYQLRVYKELSGGGSMMIVNESVPFALEKLNYSSEEIEKIKKYIDKNETIEGCEVLKKEHLPVFDCAVVAGNGTRAISPMGHIKMLAAIQPHISGAISKTINCPENTNVEEIENMFYQAWKMGVKALAIYRDGSKVAQPLKTKKISRLENLTRGERESLPDLRTGITQKVKLGNIPLFIRTGEYNDGRLGELFVDSLERGSEVNRLLNINAIQFSEKLQYGVPLEEALEIFQKAGQSQISGLTDHNFIKIAKGPEGFIYNWVMAHYLGDISFLFSEGKVIQPEMRPLPWELRVYQQVPPLHLLPTVCEEKMYPDVPSLEEIIKKISKTNYWCDEREGLDTRETIEKIKRTRVWGNENTSREISGKITGKTCDICGSLLVSDGRCSYCTKCKISTGGCSG